MRGDSLTRTSADARNGRGSKNLRKPSNCKENGAAYRTRTCDPIITNDVLYQLS